MDLWEFHGMTHPRRFENLPRDGSVTRVQVDLDATDRDLISVRDAASRAGAVLELELGAGREIVADIRLSADVSIQTVSFDSSDGASRVR